MNNSRQAVTGIVLGTFTLIAIGGAAGYWFARHGVESLHAEATSAAATTSMAASRGKPLYWYDPMQPNQHFDKPGKSPFMDMELVPKYVDEANQAGSVRVSPNAVQNLGIRTGRVEQTTYSAPLRAVGSVAFDERLLDLVQARVDGSIVALYVKVPFERVRQGQPLAAILAPQWLEAEQQYVALLAIESESPTALREAARERLIVLGVPETAIHELERTRRASATTTIYAPSDGVVTELAARQGATFAAGASLFRINGLQTVWVNAQIPEAQISAAGVGSRVKVRATAWPRAIFAARVAALLPDVDPQSRTLTARISIDNPGYRLSPGMYVTLDFAGRAGEVQLTVPTEAVITTGRRSVVIVARPDGSFDVASVAAGQEEGGRTVILSGLKEGERIVLSGQFLIDSEASLSATVSRLASSPAETKP